MFKTRPNELVGVISSATAKSDNYAIPQKYLWPTARAYAITKNVRKKKIINYKLHLSDKMTAQLEKVHFNRLSHINNC